MIRHTETGAEIEMLPALFHEARRSDGKPWVMLNMVVSIDGATAVRGGASPLNDADDRALFLHLRAVADVVLVGAQTARSEDLGPVVMSEEMLEARAEAGLSGEPRLAVVSRSLDLNPEARAFSDPDRRPIVLTGDSADEARLGALREVAEVRTVGQLDGDGIIDALGEASVILCEGGPTINGHLFASNRVDEIDVTVSPLVALGDSKRLAFGQEVDPPIPVRLDRVWIGDAALFLRYLRG
jgi:5-amino-6-(5-phosphoribosylamino)uracil reductase